VIARKDEKKSTVGGQMKQEISLETLVMLAKQAIDELLKFHLRFSLQRRYARI
jgi:hypothetical protein